jgi:hypothetical protein
MIVRTKLLRAIFSNTEKTKGTYDLAKSLIKQLYIRIPDRMVTERSGTISYIIRYIQVIVSKGYDITDTTFISFNLKPEEPHLTMITLTCSASTTRDRYLVDVDAEPIKYSWTTRIINIDRVLALH